MSVVYRAKQGGRISDKDATVFGTFIEKRFGESPVTAEALVAAAKAKRSPVHGYFEWDDVAAAEHHRLDQARDYLRSIEVVVQTKEGEDTTRAFHVITNGERAYVPQQVVWRTPEYRQQVIERAWREIESWQRRYAQYGELAGLVNAIEEVKLAA